jgi:hypothetical protein
MGGVNSINLLSAVIFKEYLKTYDIDNKKIYYFTNPDVIIKAFTANLANYFEDTIKKGEKLDKLKIIDNIKASLKPYYVPRTEYQDSSLMNYLIREYYILNKVEQQNDDKNINSFGIINDIKDKNRSYDTIGQPTTKNDIDKYLMLQGISTVYYLEKTLKKIVDDLMKKDISTEFALKKVISELINLQITKGGNISGGNYKKSKKNNKSKKSKKSNKTGGNYKKSKRSKKSKKSKKDNRNKKK